MMGNFKKLWSVGNFLFISIGLIGIVAVFTFGSTSTKTEKIDSPKVSNMVVSGITIPDNLAFAEEKVPLNYFDVKESLERELLINSYWHSQTILLIKRSARYFGDIEPILKKNNVPDDFKYLALAESGFTNISSPAGAVGFWQFLPQTAKDYKLEISDEVDERYHLQKSTEAACKYLKHMYSIYNSWTMAAASFNMGSTGLGKQVHRQLTDNYYDILLNEETSRYVYRILALKLILSDPPKYGFNISKDDYYQPIPYSEITVSQSVKDLIKFSYENGTNYKLLKILNPWLHENKMTHENTLTVKAGKSYVVRIPVAGFRDHTKELKREEFDKIATQSEESVQ